MNPCGRFGNTSPRTRSGGRWIRRTRGHIPVGARRAVLLSSRDPADQCLVGWWKPERGQVGAGGPAHLLPEQGSRRSLQRAAIEVQRNRAVGIVVGGVEDERADLDVGVELFAHLTSQRVGVAL